MNFAELDNEVEDLIRDSDITSVERRALLNEVYQQACFEARLPALKRVGTLNTVLESASTSLSGLAGGCCGWVSKVVNSSGVELDQVASLDILLGLYPTLAETGSVETWAVEGPLLWYQPIPSPSVETLTLLYYAEPPALTSDEDEPELLPSFLHRAVLVEGAAAKLFDKIECGIEDPKTNTLVARAAFERGMQQLHAWVGKNRRHFVSGRHSV